MGPYGELKRTQYQFCASVTMQILRQINMYVHTTTWSVAWYSTTGISDAVRYERESIAVAHGERVTDLVQY